MKNYKVVIPFHWYSGESHTPPPYITQFFTNKKDAQKLQRRADKAYELHEAHNRNWCIYGELPKESETRFLKELDNSLGLCVNGFINGPARLYEVKEEEIK